MSYLSTFGIPGASAGILHPLLANRFRVLYRSSAFGVDSNKELTAQTVRIKTDFKNKELRLSVEQPITGEVLELLHEMISHPSCITVQAMDGSDGVISSMDFSQLQAISHDFTLDYAAPCSIATHEVVMKYNHMLIKSIIPEKK